MSLTEVDPIVLAPAFVAGLLVLLTHVPMGQEVLKRGIIFIDLALAQIAGLGLIAAAQLGWQLQGWEVQLLAMASALSGAVLLHWMERRWGRRQEALIGVLFILAATGSILLLANHPHGGESLKDLLVGQILWIDWPQLWPMLLVTALVLPLWYYSRWFDRGGFYFLFALAVTSSVQLVGVYLVFASLIIPALGSLGYRGKKSVAVGYVIGALGYALGLFFSSVFDLPSGAVIVWTIALTALLMRFFVFKSIEQLGG
ncbi:MAG: iron chelate uptake ABC transporter family permease subunit [Gammaproteobacteria bacterium]|nr:iron chelate uptake ABC transporter family permease subunit [Gammaproteobacteria bacterium]